MICTFRISFLVAEKRLINVFPSVRNQFSFQPTSYLALFFSQIQTWMTRLFTSRRTPNLPCHLRSAIKIWWTCYSHRYENHLKRVFIPQLEVNWSNVSCTNWQKAKFLPNPRYHWLKQLFTALCAISLSSHLIQVDSENLSFQEILRPPKAATQVMDQIQVGLRRGFRSILWENICHLCLSFTSSLPPLRVNSIRLLTAMTSCKALKL